MVVGKIEKLSHARVLGTVQNLPGVLSIPFRGLLLLKKKITTYIEQTNKQNKVKNKSQVSLYTRGQKKGKSCDIYYTRSTCIPRSAIEVTNWSMIPHGMFMNLCSAIRQRCAFSCPCRRAIRWNMANTRYAAGDEMMGDIYVCLPTTCRLVVTRFSSIYRHVHSARTFIKHFPRWTL